MIRKGGLKETEKKNFFRFVSLLSCILIGIFIFTLTVERFLSPSLLIKLII